MIWGKFVPLLLQAILFLLSECATTLTTNETDRLALIAFKNQIASDPSQALASWNHSLHFCHWTGVSCGRRRQRVTGLDLVGLQLRGTLSPRIANLTFLGDLNLAGNSLHGGIPMEIGGLIRLQFLDLSENSFGGEIPLNLTQCSSLKGLALDQNILTGEIPHQIGSLSKLEELHLGYNNLIGSIPSSIGSLKSLTDFSVSYNQLTGEIPHQIGSLSNLEYLFLRHNNLIGSIPSSIGSLKSLIYFWVSDNQLTGEIPISLTNASGLEVIYLHSNGFSGLIPDNFGSCKELRYLLLSNNQLGTGGRSDDWGFLDSLTNCTRLSGLYLDQNSLGGAFPNTIANLPQSLSYLSLGGNQIYGSIPHRFGNIINLFELNLRENLLTGPIPDSVKQLTKLLRLDLSGNDISGEIPSSLCNNAPLYRLSLDHNSLEGRIPSCIGDFGSLRYLDLSHNNFSNIPTEIFSLLYSTIYTNLSRNSLKGHLHTPSSTFPIGIPPIQTLDLSYNRLSGPIPEFLETFIDLQALDLSNNRLSGPIPEYLETFIELQVLDLSFNDFEGEVPQNGIFRNASAIILHNNPKLCGGNHKLKLSSCPNQPLKKNTPSKKQIKIVVIKIVTPVVIGVVICAVALSCFYHWLGKSREKLFTVPLETQYPQVSYQELVEATDGFSSANLIGVGSYGSVYRGFVGPENEMVAIKVFRLLKRGGLNSFLAECETLKNIRHRNLVSIITACSSIDLKGQEFKALVFDYMPNATLENWLHPRGNYRYLMRSLTFVERLNIAIDIAAALEYLHHYCHTPIVHCDLKPSNVLLDSDMTAHVGDFGLARFLSEAATNFSHGSTSSSRIKGSIGYIPPEYGITGKVSTRGDVYSYGILLLEMFTGKTPTHGMFKDGLSLHQHAKMSLPNHVKDILDPNLVLEKKVPPNVGVSQNCTKSKLCECATSIIKIAVSCSNEYPRDRMYMNKIMKEMQTIRDRLMEADSRKEIPCMPHLLGEESPFTS